MISTTNTSPSTMEQSTANKLLFSNPSTGANHSNSNANNRYSPSNFYRAAAVAAAATSDSNNRRYMPNTPVCRLNNL